MNIKLKGGDKMKCIIRKRKVVLNGIKIKPLKMI